MAIRRIVQKDRTGCGLACIAMLAECEYSQVKKAYLELFERASNDEYYTRAPDLRKLGQAFSLDIGGRRRKFKNFQDLPKLAILAINYREDEGTWHWVVFCRTADEKFVLDPKKSVKSERRTDFGRLAKNTRWFVSVAHASSYRRRLSKPSKIEIPLLKRCFLDRTLDPHN